MSKYQFANRDGSIVVEDYDGSTYCSAKQLLKSLKDAFELFPYAVEIAQEEDFDDVFHIKYPAGDGLGDIYICGKGTTPGGRKGLTDEQRIQPKAKHLNYVFDRQSEGKKGVFLGVYLRDGQTIFCTWKVSRSIAASPETPISKQIKIESISKAIQEGFVQQDKGRGEYACAFKPEFLYFYLRNCDWLHTGKVNELAEHTLPENENPNNWVTGLTQQMVFETGVNSEFPRNRIIFGAPGTGKSYMLNCDKDVLLCNGGDFERVTFHPDYSYANFVGTYKPVKDKKGGIAYTITDKQGGITYEVTDEKGGITYEYVPGPFMRVYVNALKSARTENPQPYLLIIEEINRANVAAVFGDIFQLLDRDDNGVSEYLIQASEDIKKYLAKELDGEPDDYAKLRLPNNMFIWATMNSADQGVFPMDTAFKRRWDFTYLGIDDNDGDICGKFVKVGANKKQRIEWNSLRKAINEFLANEKINEDKQLGPYFMSRSIVVPADGGTEIDSEKFCNAFKNKVLMYLFEDAAKQKRPTLFDGSKYGQTRYSKICEAFDEQGIDIFNKAIRDAVKIVDADDTELELDSDGNE